MARSHVSKREADRIVGYAVAVCDLMRMPKWKILVMEDPAENDAYAAINWIDQRHVAQLWLSPDWMKLDTDTRRNSITHEVMHLVHARVSTVAFDDTRHLMHDHEHNDWTRRLRREFELMVDHLATFMADTHRLEEAWTAALPSKRS